MEREVTTLLGNRSWNYSLTLGLASQYRGTTYGSVMVVLLTMSFVDFACVSRFHVYIWSSALVATITHFMWVNLVYLEDMDVCRILVVMLLLEKK